MVLFTIIIFAAIFYLFKVTFEKVRGALVAWDNSELWCIKIEHRFEEHNRSMEELQDRCQELQHSNNDLADKIERLYNMYCELKKLTGTDVKKTEMDAEREITQDA